MMEQRSEIIKRFGSGNRKQSLLLEQEVDGRVIRFRIRKPSMADFEESLPLAHHERGNLEHYPMVDIQPAQVTDQPQAQQLPSPSQTSGAPAENNTAQAQSNLFNSLRPDEANVRRMHTALTLNEAILKRSKSAKLVIINLPGAPKSCAPEAENNCKYCAEFNLKLILCLFTFNCPITVKFLPSTLDWQHSSCLVYLLTLLFSFSTPSN